VANDDPVELRRWLQAVERLQAPIDAPPPFQVGLKLIVTPGAGHHPPSGTTFIAATPAANDADGSVAVPSA
jgi:hypothetical protein